MKQISMRALLSAARVLVAPLFDRAPTLTVTAPLIDLTALRNTMPRAVAAMPMAKASTPEELVAAIQTGFEEFKASVNLQLAAKAEDPVLTAKIEAINADLTKMNAAFEQQAAALAAARLGGGGSGGQLTPEAAAHRDVFNTWFRKGDRAIDADMRDLEVKASLTTQSDPDGGYLVPVEMEQGIDRVLGTVSTVRQLARVIQIGGGSYKKLVNLGGTSSGWVGEEDARPETNTPRLSEIEIVPGEIYANPAATQTLLDDARVDIATWLAEEVSIEFAEKEGAAFVSGDGVKKPRGFLSYTKITNGSYAWGKIGYVPTGEAAIFPAPTASVSPADILIAAYYALKAGYRANASWLMSDAVMETVRKFKNADGDFIWAPPSSTADVATILQKPVYTDDNMETIAAGKYPIAFADFKRAYTVVDRMGTRVLRDPFSNKPYVHFYTTKRVGGGVTNFEAMKLIKVAAS